MGGLLFASYQLVPCIHASRYLMCHMHLSQIQIPIYIYIHYRTKLYIDLLYFLDIVYLYLNRVCVRSPELQFTLYYSSLVSVHVFLVPALSSSATLYLNPRSNIPYCFFFYICYYSSFKQVFFILFCAQYLIVHACLVQGYNVPLIMQLRLVHVSVYSCRYSSQLGVHNQIRTLILQNNQVFTSTACCVKTNNQETETKL